MYVLSVFDQNLHSRSCMSILLCQVVYKHGKRILPLLKEVIRQEMAGCNRQMGKWVETTRQSCSAEEAVLPEYQRLNHCQASGSGELQGGIWRRLKRSLCRCLQETPIRRSRQLWRLCVFWNTAGSNASVIIWSGTETVTNEKKIQESNSPYSALKFERRRVN